MGSLPPPKRVLLLCRHNRLRSKTTEWIFGKRSDLDARSAGTAVDALTRLNARILEWADRIFIMDDQQRRSLRRRFAGHPTLEHLIRLETPDDFTFMQAVMVDVLTARPTPRLPLAAKPARGMRPARRVRTRHAGIRKRTQ